MNTHSNHDQNGSPSMSPRHEVERDYAPSSAKRSALMLGGVVAVLFATSLLVFAHYQEAHQSRLHLLER